jgi:hypothetical protein
MRLSTRNYGKFVEFNSGIGEKTRFFLLIAARLIAARFTIYVHDRAAGPSY